MTFGVLFCCFKVRSILCNGNSIVFSLLPVNDRGGLQASGGSVLQGVCSGARGLLLRDLARFDS